MSERVFKLRRRSGSASRAGPRASPRPPAGAAGGGDVGAGRSATGPRRSTRSWRWPRPTSALWPAFPDDYHVLFLQGGATLQFSMVPMNLLPAGGTADYLLTGTWAVQAAREAEKFGSVRVAASTEAEGFRRLPAAAEIDLSPIAAYVHATTNNTIAGTQWPAMPDVGDRPLVVDASSDILSRPIDVAGHGLIYAGAQKNLGPARRDGGDRPTGPGGAGTVVAPEAAPLRHVRPGRAPGPTRRRSSPSTWCRWSRRGCAIRVACRPRLRGTSARRRSCTRPSTAPTSTAAWPIGTAAR